MCGMVRVPWQAVAGRLFGELLVGGLVFISGYTYFSHYWKHSQFNWRRIGYVLFRVNLLPVLLSLTLGDIIWGLYSAHTPVTWFPLHVSLHGLLASDDSS
ncbi:hypothetical protein GBAR_LOCUS3797 [Geodia barretti]|uniref:Cas1p 10 TM acyl transferase domain-containing protein n=1 Tax=Geodia barretti TaxID=519541 RepID=A0AA35R595_GEOBA|nr:hypothetical protein GBAR_LOCUS3797 [Geodia barretti]